MTPRTLPGLRNVGAYGREDTIALIPMDLLRTFPLLHLFGPPNTASEGPLHKHVRDVLEAFAFYRPDLGYVQGMSYIAAMLSLHIAGTTVLATSSSSGSHGGSSTVPASPDAGFRPASTPSPLQRTPTSSNLTARQTSPGSAAEVSSQVGSSATLRSARAAAAAALSPVGSTFTAAAAELGTRTTTPTRVAAETLIVADDRFVTFQALANLMTRHHLYVFFAMDPGPLVAYYDLFDALLAQRRPKLVEHLNECAVQTEMFLFSWFQTLFLKVLPLNAAAHVWDGFLVEGVPFLYRTALALMDLLSPYLTGGMPGSRQLGNASFEETIQLLTQAPSTVGVWSSIVETDVLMQAIDNVVLPEAAVLQLEELVADPFFYRHIGGPRVPAYLSVQVPPARSGGRTDFGPRSPEAIRNAF